MGALWLHAFREGIVRAALPWLVEIEVGIDEEFVALRRAADGHYHAEDEYQEYCDDNGVY